VVTRSAEETERLGERAGLLVRPGDFIALTGELGAGKTMFVRGVAAGMGVDPSLPVTSPTYTILNTYPGRLRLNHFDLYRLSGETDVAELGFEEYFYGPGVCIVEWAERLCGLVPEEHVSIDFVYLDENARRITFAPHGERYETLVRSLAGDML